LFLAKNMDKMYCYNSKCWKYTEQEYCSDCFEKVIVKSPFWSFNLQLNFMTRTIADDADPSDHIEIGKLITKNEIQEQWSLVRSYIFKKVLAYNYFTEDIWVKDDLHDIVFDLLLKFRPSKEKRMLTIYWGFKKQNTSFKVKFTVTPVQSA
jgi:hypothetical protein